MKTLKEKQQAAVNYFLTKANAQLEESPHYKVVTYNTVVRGEQKPALACFLGNSAKPLHNCYFSSEERRQEIINFFKKQVSDRVNHREKRRREKKEFKTSCKIGDIFVCSWGYEQTNVDYYKLVELRGNVGTFIEIGQTKVAGSDGVDSCDVMPDPCNEIGEKFKKTIQLGERFSLSSFEYCKLWNGEKNYCSWYA